MLSINILPHRYIGRKADTGNTYYLSNSPILRKLWNINETQLTNIARHPVAILRPKNIQKPMEP